MTAHRFPPPMLHVVGRKKSGKTTVVVRLVEILTARGHRVATIKHAAHEHPRDVPGADTDRHRAAGAARAAFVTPGGFSVCVDTADAADSFATLTAWLADADVIVVEGGKNMDGPKIEAYLNADPAGPLCTADDGCVAIITDLPTDHFAPVFGSTELERLADWIEKEYLRA